MSASHGPALDAITFQLAAALENYELHVGQMVDTWLDMELYRTVSDEIEQIRMYSAALPQLSVHWVELLIAHAELVHCLWKMQYGTDAAAKEHLEGLRRRHADAAASLRKRCLRLLTESREG
jgi:hypothetical protein